MSGYFEFKRRTDGSRDQILDGIKYGGEAPAGGGPLVYPSDLFSPESAPFILFFAVHPVRTGEVLDKIALYMPKGLSVQYGLNYGQGMNMFEAAAGAQNEFNSPSQAAMRYLSDPGAAAALGIGAGAGFLSGKGFLGKIAGMGLGGMKGYGAALSNKIGQSTNVHQKALLNPHLAATFEGVNFRPHDFTFELVARNKEESETINNIIYTFKYHAHPAAGNPDNQSTFWEWPSSWHIGLFSPARKYLYNISTCQIMGMNVEYMSGGQRAFFSDTGAPVAMRLSLQFVETELLTRERIRQGF